MNHSRQIDLVYSTAKGYGSLQPLYKHLVSEGWKVRFSKVHRLCFQNRELLREISDTIVIAYDKPLVRLERCGWKGQFIYIEHGLSPMKYYTYKYDFFQRSSLLFYPGEIFKRKMEAINPVFDRGLLGGYPKIDELVKLSIDRSAFIKKYQLNPDKPVVLFAPSWGGKRNPNAGIHNAKYLKDMENVVIVPHSADYPLVKQYNAIKPGAEGVGPFLHLADVVVSDVSSVLAEASILEKPVVQLILPHYPGCFPDKEKRKSGTWISDERLAREMKTDRLARPFKIPYVDEDWIMGHEARPEELSACIEDALAHPDKFRDKREYWAEQSCYRPDGKSSQRITAMISHYMETGEVKQLD